MIFVYFLFSSKEEKRKKKKEVLNGCLLYCSKVDFGPNLIVFVSEGSNRQDIYLCLILIKSGQNKLKGRSFG